MSKAPNISSVIVFFATLTFSLEAYNADEVDYFSYDRFETSNSWFPQIVNIFITQAHRKTSQGRRQRSATRSYFFR